MLKKRIFGFIFLGSVLVVTAHAQQLLTIKDAVQTAVSNYGTVKAKTQYAAASKKLIAQSRRDYLPNFNIGAQQVYGTVNGQNGPLYGFGGLGVASSGLPLPDQNFHSAFGALYLTNINWDFFTFGRVNQRIRLAEATAERDDKDLQQEIFQHRIRVTAAYLNLLAAHQISFSYQRNLVRTDTLRRIVQARALNGLVAGVDSSLANADYSSAKILLTRAIDTEQQLMNELMQLLGTAADSTGYLLDSSILTKLPLLEHAPADSSKHPLLQLFKSRIQVSDEQVRLIKRSVYPSISLVSVLQTRASGFESSYAVNQDNFTRNYLKGIKPTRTNYLIGVGATWNITQVFRLGRQASAQELISQGLTEEFNLVNQQIKWQQQLADTKTKNALKIYQEAPVQVKAASDAYLQKTVLYKNGLTNLVDLTQAAYTLVRAETDRAVAINNVWQALLLQAAAAGDYSIFESQL